MSNFFEEFPVVDYKFGNEETTTQFQHLGTYIDIVDQVKEFNVYYENYSIKNGERPEQLSYRLYRNTNYYWTFYLLNDKLRQSGWPIRDADVFPKAQEYYPNTVLAVNGVTLTQAPMVTVNRDIVWVPNNEQVPMVKSDFFNVGDYIYFPNSHVSGKILKVDHKMGMITTDAEGIRSADTLVSAIPDAEWIKMQSDSEYVPVQQYAVMEVNQKWDEFDAPHHYEDVEGNWLFPSYSPTYPHPFNHNRLIGWNNSSSAFEVLSGRDTVNSISNYTRLAEINESQKLISVIKKDSIVKVVTEFNRLLRSE